MDASLAPNRNSLNDEVVFVALPGRVTAFSRVAKAPPVNLLWRADLFACSTLWRFACTCFSVKKTGTIEALNVSPKGFYEGFLLRAGKKLLQINLPKHGLAEMEKSLEVGSTITVELESEKPHGEPEHEVFRLLRSASANDDFSGVDHDGSKQFSGCIERLNYALHGAVNGGILDSGDFLHVKPEGARALKLKLGMQVEGRGRTKPMVDGHLVIEAEVVNGVEIERHKAARKHRPKHNKN